MSRHFKISRALFFCATALPPCLIAALILRYGVDFPFEDQWSLAHLFVRFKDGTLTFGDLFGLQNEYRQFFPNLIIIGLGWLTRWDVRYEMFFSLLLAALISFNVRSLGLKTFGADDARRRLAFLLSNLLIFSPVQYLNWLMGEQLVYFFPAACVTTCLVVACSGAGLWLRFALCALLSAVSTFSSANGIFCWALFFPALAWGGGRAVSNRTRVLLGLACAAGLALCAALYFEGYRSPPQHPSPLAVFGHPLRASAHFLSLLGSTLAGESAYLLPVAVLSGGVLFSLYAARAARVLRAGAESELTRRSVGWLMLGAYSILTAAAVTVGRSGIGVSQSLASRYTTFTLYLIVALVHLFALPRTGEAVVHGARKLNPARLVPAALAVLLCLHAAACVIAIQQMGLLRTRLLQAKACHMLVNAVPDEGCLARHVLPGLADLRSWTGALDELGFWRPGLVRSSRVEEFAAAAPVGDSGNYGSFDVLAREGDGYLASGRATLPHRREPADAVLLAYETDGGGHVAFAQAELKNRGYVFIRFWRGGARQDPGWRKSFGAGELPPGASRLTAWAFDAQTGKAFKLEGAHDLGGVQ